MNIQIFGTKKCFDTKKAERYFKERRVSFQFIDLNEKGISKGELNSVLNSVSVNDLINSKSKDYNKLNLNNIRSIDIKKEIVLKNPKVMNTPIVRNGKQATVGYTPDIWNDWE
ncbi:MULTISPECIES: arsenate reductase family protein [unclassified Clostridium]|uniref:ArsC family n=1 Tax=Clostridium botulinum (strain Eklund 17B / Type B) TaxID=935198 RepID=B2TNH2_CLOBB|nr:MULTISPECIES: arsenate reductase family protein [unclassified Clostridium]ACD22687.1 ArsC family [Clostridium botulinum B str. Eklund 17B (NRP)]AIY81162.1 glutaredoxin family protein [Clostridium botulinum 202F]KAI3346745.1 arsenate reductase family protein [Clostridium botulinum]KFX54891.1 ArsC family transcriptional regulator [Clostridium botulinum]KON13904.1 ArsC family transcriptional regulator [Clostridium botulinum]